MVELNGNLIFGLMGMLPMSDLEMFLRILCLVLASVGMALLMFEEWNYTSTMKEVKRLRAAGVNAHHTKRGFLWKVVID